MTSISAGERRAKGRNKGRNKERGCPVHSTNVVGERGGGGGGRGLLFPSRRGIFWGSSPYLDDSERFPHRQNMQVNIPSTKKMHLRK
jgi:hypothetical protein